MNRLAREGCHRRLERMKSETCDIAVVGSGIVGLAHALEARRKGLSVTVIERDHRCVGASIRNFGFITVTGQGAGATWERARRSRDVWAEVAPAARIALEHRGLWLLAQRPEARAVLEAFLRTPMGGGCEIVDPAEASRRAPWLCTDGAAGALWSPHELRVESRDAIPKLTAWLESERGVRVLRGESALGVEPGAVRTTQRTVRAARVILCPGTDLTGIAEPWLRDYPVRLCRLQMLRVRPLGGPALGSAVMSDLGLIRYRGYAALPEVAALRRRLVSEEAESLAHGIHLIAVRSADGSMVVGDSHHYDATPEPFAREDVDRLILRHLNEAVSCGPFEVTERWTGVYPSLEGSDALLLAPESQLRVVVVTSGTGASTAFGIAQETLADA